MPLISVTINLLIFGSDFSFFKQNPLDWLIAMRVSMCVMFVFDLLLVLSFFCSSLLCCGVLA